MASLNMASSSGRTTYEERSAKSLSSPVHTRKSNSCGRDLGPVERTINLWKFVGGRGFTY